MVGSAQVRVGRAFLQHGSILVEDDQEVLEALRAGGEAGHEPPGVGAGAATRVTLAELLGGTPERGALEKALLEGLEAVLGGTWEPGAYGPERESLIEKRAHVYRSPEWTWRR
ncbi:MAG: lipoate--protein ligase family protein [Gemmatimonadetes bacterium]|nr:MAG: lipoate--protein ligase family protein [Gemmatimonadota bacterium]